MRVIAANAFLLNMKLIIPKIVFKSSVKPSFVYARCSLAWLRKY